MANSKIKENLKKLDIASASQLENHDIAFWWANKYKEIKANQYLSNEEKVAIINEINIARDELLEIEIEILKKNLKFNISEKKSDETIENTNKEKFSKAQNVFEPLKFFFTRSYNLKIKGTIFGGILFSYFLIYTLASQRCPLSEAKFLKNINCAQQPYILVFLIIFFIFCIFYEKSKLINPNIPFCEINSKGLIIRKHSFWIFSYKRIFISINKIYKATAFDKVVWIDLTKKSYKNQLLRINFTAEKEEQADQVANIINKMVNDFKKL